jgi:cell division protein FtsN
MHEKQLYFNGLKDKEELVKGRLPMNLRLDSIIIFGVIMLLLLAASFSLGVERGKHLMTASTNKTGFETLEANFLAPEQTVQSISPIAHSEELVNEGNKNPATESIDIALQTEKVPVQKQYRVQVASFKKKDAAQKEAIRLQDNGYQAYHYKSGDYNVVYVEGRNTKEETEKILTALKKKYKDCLLRRL